MPHRTRESSHVGVAASPSPGKTTCHRRFPKSPHRLNGIRCAQRCWAGSRGGEPSPRKTTVTSDDDDDDHIVTDVFLGEGSPPSQERCARLNASATRSALGRGCWGGEPFPREPGWSTHPHPAPPCIVPILRMFFKRRALIVVDVRRRRRIHPRIGYDNEKVTPNPPPGSSATRMMHHME